MLFSNVGLKCSHIAKESFPTNISSYPKKSLHTIQRDKVICTGKGHGSCVSIYVSRIKLFLSEYMNDNQVQDDILYINNCPTTTNEPESREVYHVYQSLLLLLCVTMP